MSMENTEEKIKAIIKTEISVENAEKCIDDLEDTAIGFSLWSNDEIRLDGHFSLKHLIAIIRLHPSITPE